jgi:ABC-2 type transport system permease protein
MTRVVNFCRDFLGGAVLQLRLFRRSPAYLLVLIVPPFLSTIFLSDARYYSHARVTAAPVLAPALIGLWTVAVVVAQMVVTFDRGSYTLEIITAAPAAFINVVTGRVLTVVLFALVSVLEALAVARFGFGVTVTIQHPVIFVLALLATAVASAGTTTILMGAFLASRSAQRYANTLGYPFYILAGLIVPVTFLPAWVRPIGDVVYLRWSAPLLYATVSRGAIPHPGGSLLLIMALGCAGYAIGALLIRMVINRLRASGRIGLT